MEEKRETSSGPSSKPASISGLSGEKGDEDGSEEKDELGSKRPKLQHLDSDVLAKDVRPKPSSVSQDDDRLVANALPETRIRKDNSNCETRGGVHNVVAVVSNNSSVLKPTEPVVIPRDASVSHPFQMSSALEKQDSMRTWMEMKRNGFLSVASGGPVASRPRKRWKGRGDSSKKTTNQVPKKKDQHVTAPPSGLLTGFKPGIIRHVRSKVQVCSALEALIRNADLSVRGDSAREDRALASKLPSSTTVSDHAISFTDPEQAKSLAVEAATVASQWLDFLHQDLSGRLSAVKDSRKRADDTLNKTVTEAHQMKWSAIFEEFTKHLHDEEKDLEHSLNEVKDMQSRCNEGLRQMNEASCGEDGTSHEINLAVQAAAASIFSTCRYLLSERKPPPNSS